MGSRFVLSYDIQAQGETSVFRRAAWPLTLQKPKVLSPRRGQKLSGEETQRNMQ